MKKVKIIIRILLLVLICSCCSSGLKDDVYDASHICSNSFLKDWNQSTLIAFGKHNYANTSNYKTFSNYRKNDRRNFLDIVKTQINDKIRNIYILEIETFGEVNESINYFFVEGLVNDSVYIYSKSTKWKLLRKETFNKVNLEKFYQETIEIKKCQEDLYKPNNNATCIFSKISANKIESYIIIDFCEIIMDEFSAIVSPK